MGSTTSTSKPTGGAGTTAKDNKILKSEIKARKVADATEKINVLKESVVDGIKSGNVGVDTANNLINIANTSNAQLNKGGEQFTKPDLIAITMFINPNKNMSELQGLTCDDLRSIIRSNVYNVEHYIQHLSTTGGATSQKQLETGTNSALPMSAQISNYVSEGVVKYSTTSKAAERSAKYADLFA